MAEGKAADGAEETAPRDGEKSGATPTKPPEATAEPTRSAQTEPEPSTGSSGASDSKPSESSSSTTSTTTTKASSKTKASSGRSSRDADDEKGSKGGSGAKGSVDQIRSTVATIVWVVAVLCALILAAGALVVALDFNARNDAVKFLTDTAEKINFLGDMKTFKPDGKSRDAIQSARTKEVLVNWGICAVVYLVGGKLLDRLIRP